ncbi:magnesium transporter [Clostridium felsineum]|uniref:Inosine-5'-monophosphate dehydrogenase n=1 Tax=Clostridium felsineum TaxID=36839 RepID=A0A1S8LUW1_9CLOT|nr:CBS domain-containing protein [Clostridium felsineum]MCR3758840.1 CBS domain-containing protein [Clostridium felsineum]URZ05397.1 Inosine-5'-monophosphate dehydrogenase [Clostridium felsineum]URZ10438.1 Inosine-5'-monophosphate dehydrogenase [Clostridium felsineum]URZ17633.1 Inosine-5'-monophosphate dehydrogenase [Clostridium felsineum DSM 794]
MQKLLNNFFLSEILYKKVYDEYGEYVGRLWDIYVVADEAYPRAIGYKVKKSGEYINYEFKTIDFYKEDEGRRIYIKVKAVKDTMMRKYSYLLSKNLLDKQIVDINGKKLVRVNDLRMAKMVGELKVIAVDTGFMALSRRLGIEGLIYRFYKLAQRKPMENYIMWNDVESLEMVNDNLKLTVPYQKLSTMHPADLADILEDMDFKYRKKVFESLDENLAADILEEIDPDIQADILENLSDDKKSEVLDSMPNDEIADILDEVDEETAEKILLNMEKEDAEEVRALMGYAEETVGSIMNKDFISFNVNITLNETLEIVREMNPDDEVIYFIYITDDEGKLEGYISLKDLLFMPPEKKLKDVMNKKLAFVKDSDKLDEAIEISSKYNLISLPVVDNENKICGIILVNDLIDEVLLPTWKKKFKKVG